MYKGEKLNSVTHLIATVIAIAGTAVMVTLASIYGDTWKIVSVSIYGGMLILLYLFSTLYHSFQGKPKEILQKFDHVAIYLLIAGTYTPFTLVTLRGVWGWWLFGLNWGLALFGTFQELTLGRKNRTLSLVLYILMGWMIVVAFKPLSDHLPMLGLMWLALGGLFYTSGIVFYVLDEKVRHAHGIWHLFVMAGSISHYICVLLYVI